MSNPTQRSTSFAQTAARYLPPFLVDLARYWAAEWKYLPDGWSGRNSRVKGWNDQTVADAQKTHWPVLAANVEGTGPLGVSHFPWVQTREDPPSHNAMMSFGYVLARAARKKDALSLLDWGGGLGHYYLYCKALLPEVEIEYHCHDLPLLCGVGKSLQPGARFSSDPEVSLDRRYDLVMTSSSLHYFEDWRGMTRRLAAVTSEFLYVARLQTVREAPSFVVVQRPKRKGYDTEYLSWFLNRQEFVSYVEETGLELVREFLFMEAWSPKGAPEPGSCRGFLFRRSAETRRSNGAG